MEGAGVSLSSGTPKYVIDGFAASYTGTGTFACSQTASAPSGFPNAITINCTVANSLAGANDGQWFQTPIEGYRWSRLGWGTAVAQPITIGFWVIPNITGTMAVAVQNVSAPRTYVVDVPVTAGSWQYKTVTVPGDVSGTWPKANTTGACIYFVFGVGSGRKITPDVWRECLLQARHRQPISFLYRETSTSQV